MSNITIRMDENLKKQVDALFSDLGISFNTAVVMFAKQALAEQGIPFKITRKITTTAPDDLISQTSKKLIEENISAYQELAK